MCRGGDGLVRECVVFVRTVLFNLDRENHFCKGLIQPFGKYGDLLYC